MFEWVFAGLGGVKKDILIEYEGFTALKMRKNKLTGKKSGSIVPDFLTGIFH